MNNTVIRLRDEAAKLMGAILKHPDATQISMTLELAEFMTLELGTLQFSDGDIYYMGRLITLNDDLPCFWDVQ